MRKGEKKFVSAIPNTRQNTPYELEKAYKTIAFARSPKLNYRTLDDLDTEAERIKRCVAHYYTYTDHDMSFSDYCTKFIMENFKEMVFGKEFD
jgi:hypothetical protein